MPRLALTKRNQAEQQEQAENKNFPGSHQSVFLSALGVVDGNLRTSRPEVLGHYRQVKAWNTRGMIKGIILSRPVERDSSQVRIGQFNSQPALLRQHRISGSNAVELAAHVVDHKEIAVRPVGVA